MKNSKFDTLDVKTRCENKLDIVFKSSGELNGWYLLGEKRVARITVPHGRKFIPPKTYKSMATQLKLSVDDFDALLECPLTGAKYEEKIQALAQQGLL